MEGDIYRERYRYIYIQREREEERDSAVNAYIAYTYSVVSAVNQVGGHLSLSLSLYVTQNFYTPRSNFFALYVVSLSAANCFCIYHSHASIHIHLNSLSMLPCPVCAYIYICIHIHIYIETSVTEKERERERKRNEEALCIYIFEKLQRYRAVSRRRRAVEQAPSLSFFPPASFSK